MSEREKRPERVVPSGSFVLRTPLFPFSTLEAWGGEVEAVRHLDDPAELDRALARDEERLRSRLRELVGSPEFADALLVASSTLRAAVAQWHDEPESDRGRSTEEALVAYLSRAAARPTPFGLFAGSTTGTIAIKTDIRLESRATYRRHSRLDIDYLSALAAEVAGNPSLRKRLLYRPNSSLYEVGGRFHYVEGRQTAAGRSYTLVAVEKTPYLEATLERARAGARIETLAAALVDDEVTQADAEDYVGELVESQILTADIGPQLTGPSPDDALIQAFERLDGAAALAAPLRRAREQLAEIDDAGVGVSPDRYEAVGSTLAELPVAQPDLSKLVQVDLAKPAVEVTLGRNVISEIVNAVRILHAFSPTGANDALARFRDEFTERYETREVPLVEALDEEHGIGFDRSGGIGDETPPLLAGLPLVRGHDDTPRWNLRDGLLLRKLSASLALGSSEIVIEESDIQAAELLGGAPLPGAFEVLASLAATSSQAADGGDFRVHVQSASGPPGARLLGRFCHIDDRLHELVRANLRAEESTSPEAAFAEIVHQPEGRVGNILTRPVLRDYEIPYLAISGAPPDRQIPVSDLLVSVDGGAIVLRSRRLERRVVPRLTTAHNYSRRSLRVYRFLCALQNQDVVPGVMWHWGVLEQARFLPRVVSGRAVLSRARWNLDHDELGAFREPRGGRLFTAVQRLRADRSLPRWVALADADNELVVDLDNALSVEALARQVRKRSGAALVELFPPAAELCVEGPEGRFTSQFVIPFVREAPTAAPAPTRRPERIERRFPPGSEWLYLKVFSGPATTDIVLDGAARTVRDAIASGAADRWFFIRYADPHWHLRLRVHGEPERLLSEVLPALHSSVSQFIDTGRVWRVQLDTYEREVERYGGDRGIALSEAVFHADSDTVVELVQSLGPGDSDVRWRVALLGIDLLLEDFCLTLEEKREVARRACQGYGREFGAGKRFKDEVSRRYRGERDAVEDLVTRRYAGTEIGPVVDALRTRSERLRPVAEELRVLADADELTQTVAEMVMSYAHMHVNRLLRSAPRAQELVLYEFLARAYSSQAARR